jgi:hypothetical protein
MHWEMIIRANIFCLGYNTLVFLLSVSHGLADDGAQMVTGDVEFPYTMPSSRISSAMILNATIMFEKIT